MRSNSTARRSRAYVRGVSDIHRGSGGRPGTIQYCMCAQSVADLKVPLPLPLPLGLVVTGGTQASLVGKCRSPAQRAASWRNDLWPPQLLARQRITGTAAFGVYCQNMDLSATLLPLGRVLTDPTRTCPWIQAFVEDILESAIAESYRQWFDRSVRVSGLDAQLEPYKRRRVADTGAIANIIIRARRFRAGCGALSPSRFVSAHPQVVRGPNSCGLIRLFIQPAGFAP